MVTRIAFLLKVDVIIRWNYFLLQLGGGKGNCPTGDLERTKYVWSRVTRSVARRRWCVTITVGTAGGSRHV